MRRRTRTRPPAAWQRAPSRLYIACKSCSNRPKSIEYEWKHDVIGDIGEETASNRFDNRPVLVQTRDMRSVLWMTAAASVLGALAVAAAALASGAAAQPLTVAAASDL